MNRIIFLGSIAFGLLIFGLLTRKGDLLILSIPFIIYLGSALLYGTTPVQIQATRTLSSNSVLPETPVGVSITIHNQGAYLEEVWVEDLLSPSLQIIGGDTKTLASLAPDESLTYTYTISGKRGVHTFNLIKVIVSDHFGILKRSIKLSVTTHLKIYPNVMRLRSLMVRPLCTHLYSGPIQTKTGGAGVNFLNVRDYQSGDPLRWMNWRMSARYDESLFINEFEQERVTDIGLVLDARQQTDVELTIDSLFEHAVQATAALAATFLRDGNRVGLLIYGRGQELTFPGYGKKQANKIFSALALAKTGDNLALNNLDYLPTRFFPSHSQIILVSSLAEGDLSVLTRLRALGYQVSVISPDPVTFRVAGLHDSNEPIISLEMARRLARIERVLLLRKLQRVGILVVDWQIDQPLDQAIRVSFGQIQTQYRQVDYSTKILHKYV